MSIPQNIDSIFSRLDIRTTSISPSLVRLEFPTNWTNSEDYPIFGRFQYPICNLSAVPVTVSGQSLAEDAFAGVVRLLELNFKHSVGRVSLFCLDGARSDAEYAVVCESMFFYGVQLPDPARSLEGQGELRAVTEENATFFEFEVKTRLQALLKMCSEVETILSLGLAPESRK
jgi:hypothetical protein